MTDWWTEIDEAVLACLESGAMAPAAVAQRLGMSEAAVGSLLAMLVYDGRVRISLVESVESPRRTARDTIPQPAA
jgi:hypothetical protein